MCSSLFPLSFVSCLMCIFAFFVFQEDDQLSEPDYVSQVECEKYLFVFLTPVNNYLDSQTGQRTV